MSSDYPVPLVDLTPWFDGSDRYGGAHAVDRALTSAGFFLVTANSVDLTLLAHTRGRVALRGDNVWPCQPAGFRATVTRYIAAMDDEMPGDDRP